MYCSKCGKVVPDNSKFCPSCGASVSTGSQIKNGVDDAFKSAEKGIDDAIKDVGNTFNNNGQPVYGERLTDNRSLPAYILLSLITCGIYGWYFVYKMAHDVNVACAGDGDETGGLVKYILLNLVTCGIYGLYWEYKLGNRLAQNAPRYGLKFAENGTTVLLWAAIGYLGYLACTGIVFLAVFLAAGWYAMYILIKNTNAVCAAYNAYNHL